MRYEARQDKLEAMFEMFEEFVRDFRRETNGYFAETDKKLAALTEAQAKTDEQMKRTDERIKALVTQQARTDEQIHLLLARNGSEKPKTKVKKVKKATKKGGAAK
jgi:uncharacterized protein (DUF3084 family)